VKNATSRDFASGHFRRTPLFSVSPWRYSLGMDISFPGLADEDQPLARIFVERYLQKGNSISYARHDLLRAGFPEEKLNRVTDYLNSENERMSNLTKNDPRGILESVSENWFLGQGSTWLSFKSLLESKKTMSSNDIFELDRNTDEILNQGFSPASDPNFKVKRGLILGHVQSGKTTNFLAVIAKAVDAGYKLIVVLTGMNENLRLQTQLRIESQLVSLNEAQWVLLTDKHSDFRKNSKNVKSTLIGVNDERPVAIAIMKKNTNILASFHRWLSDLSYEARETIPMLVIDDEADQASPDAGRKTQSKINFRIEEITDPDFMPKNVYLGYTATPFANMFMDASTDRKLYPRDFIYPIKPGSGYFGAVQLYGRDLLDGEIESIPPELYVIRDIPENEGEAIAHNAWSYRTEMLSSDERLIEAMYWFILASACRNLREESSCWNTMLIHTSSRTADHFQMAAQIKHIVKDLKDIESNGQVVLAQLEKLWISERDEVQADTTSEVPDFADLKDECLRVIELVKVCVDNSKSEDRILFESVDEHGRAVSPRPQIVVGGNTLSRGLTLEGLISTYFLRTSDQYDTVLQMARWFGYRPGYEDLIRVWMPNYAPKVFKDTFKKLALVEAEIRDEIAQARSRGLTPAQLPIRIQQMPGLQITRKAAMKFAIPESVSYQGQRQQINAFANDKDILQRNKNLGLRFIEQMINLNGVTHGRSNVPVFRFVDSELVIEFLDSFTYFDSISNDNMKLLAEYIKKANSEGLLRNWNVYVASPSDRGAAANDSFQVGAQTFKKIRRSKEKNRPYLLVPTLTSPSDPICDITEDMLKTERVKSLWNRGHLTNIEINELRDAAYEETSAPGLLGLYLIDKNSKYKKNSATSQGAAKKREYADLEAVEDVLAMSATIPTPPKGSLNSTYIKLDPSRLPPIEFYDEDAEIMDEADGYYGSNG